MFAAQIQNLPPTPAPPPVEVVTKKKKRRVGGGWPHEPTDDPYDPFAYEAMAERDVEVELGALVKEAQDEISFLADEMSVEVDDLDTEVMIESSHVGGSSIPAARSPIRDDGDDDI